MKPYDTNLLTRLEKWSPDIPDSPFPFSQRLARENGWSPAYTQRVIREYKRFLFMAVAAGHPVSPSDQVDQAWHLHLLYTELYWGELCPKILGCPLHHGPTKGGSREKDKFNDWYSRTLNSYRQFFGEDAAADIWPAPEQRFAEIHFVRVNRARHWIITKPTLPTVNLPDLKALWQRVGNAFGVVGFLLAAVITLTGCGTDVGFTNGSLNPFNWTAEPFLWFFAILWAATAGVAGYLGHRARLHEDPVGGPAPQLAPYEMAFLGGGRTRVVFAAISSLAAKGAVVIDETKGRLYKTVASQQLDPVEAAIHGQINVENKFDAEKSGSEFRTIGQACNEMPIITRIEARLHELGLMTTRKNRVQYTLIPTLVALIAPAVGFLRVVFAVVRDRPFGYIFLLSCVSLITALFFVGIRYRTARGEELFKALKDKNTGLELPRRSTGLSLGAAAVPIAVGLFGPSILADTEIGDIEKKLKLNLNASSSGCGSAGCGSSCGGGGGCGGGGCGGCA